jgi:hypothetical protein
MARVYMSSTLSRDPRSSCARVPCATLALARAAVRTKVVEKALAGCIMPTGNANYGRRAIGDGQRVILSEAKDLLSGGPKADPSLRSG